MAAKFTKRADGRYATSVTMGVDENGKPQKKIVYAKTIRELEQKAAELRKQISEGTAVEGGDTLMRNWAGDWLDTYKPNKEGNTYAMYETVVRLHIIPEIGHLKLKDVRPHHVQQLINSQIANGLKRTHEQTLMTLKQMFKRAIENNMLVKNPADLVEKQRKTKPKKRALTDEERIAVEQADLDIKCRAFVYVLLYAGLRRGEAIALTRKDIDMSKKTISVDKTWTTVKGKVSIKPMPKTDAGNRTIPMPAELYHVMQEHLSLAKQSQVFPSAKGEVMSESSFKRFWGKIERRLNIALGGSSTLQILSEDVTPHIFRHTYATMLYYAGVDVKAAQYLLGHSSITITLEIYTHLDASKVADTASKIDLYLSGSQKVVN